MKVQIIHNRNPDGDCTIDVYFDGKRDADAEVEDIDPGRGCDLVDVVARRAAARVRADLLGTDFYTDLSKLLDDAPFERF